MFCRFYTSSLLPLEASESLVGCNQHKNLVSIGGLHLEPVTSCINNVLPGWYPPSLFALLFCLCS